MSDTLIPKDQKAELKKLSLPSKNFVSNYSVAYQIADEAVLSHQEYWDVIAACEEHIDGKKPYDPDELKKKGMSWASNFNYGKARAKIEKNVSESVAKVSAALALGYVTFTNYEEEHKNDKVLSFLNDFEKRGVVAANIGMALASTLAKETRLSGWLNEIEYPSFSFGYAALCFDTFDWMPTPVHPRNIAFKPKTKPDDIKTWVTFKHVDASELYDRWIEAYNETITVDKSESKPKRIASSGWNLEALEETLLHAYRGKINGCTVSSWDQVIPLYQEDPSSVIMDTQSIMIAKIYHKENNGNLTETYIPYGNEWQNGKHRGTGQSFTCCGLLFSKDRGQYNQRMFIGLIRDSGYTSGDNYIQNLRGICKFSVEDSIRYNRGRNNMNNKMTFVGSPMFEQSNTGSGDKFKLTVSQGFLLLPPSHQLLAHQPTFDVSSHINVLGFEEREFNRDTQQYDASIQGRLTSRPNKGEVEQVTAEVKFTDAAKSNVKFKDYSAIFLSVLQRLPRVKCNKTDKGYEGKYRFYESVKKSLPWLVKTDADVNKILGVIDSFVFDPVTTNIETITIALQMAETPYARNRFRRMMLIAKGMPIEEVNIAVPLTADKFSNLQDSRVVAIENDMMFTTNEIILAGTDDHIVHLDGHFAKCIKIIEGFKQQALSPVDAFKYLENNLAHSLGHIKLLGEDPFFNKKAQEYYSQFEQLVKAKDEIKRVAEQMMEAEQAKAQQVQMDPETEADIAAKNAKTQSDIQRKDAIAVSKAEQRNKQIELDHEAKLEKVRLDAQIKQQEQMYQQ